MLIKDEDINAYHENEAFGCTACKKLHHNFGGSPAYFHDVNTGLIKKERKACWDLGNAYHWYFLERDDFENRIAVRPPGLKFTTKEGKAWKAEQGDKLTVTTDEMAGILLAEKRMEPEVRALIGHKSALVEPTIRITRNGFVTQARPDQWNPLLGTADDLKTTSKFESFSRDAFKMGYHFQEAWIRRHILEETCEAIQSFRFLVFETVPPYRTAVREWDETALAIGDQLVDDTLDILERGFGEEYWPTNHTISSTMYTPAWAMDQLPEVDADDIILGHEVEL